MRGLFAFVAGGLFGAGLFLSGMTDTNRVQGWLDVFGDWDPTLAFVMGGAIMPMAIAWRLTRGRAPLTGGEFPARPEPRLGRNLVLGSVMFGMGWGLAGLCPGPAIAALSFGHWGLYLFMGAMLLGMFGTPMIRRQLDRRTDPA